MVTRVPGATGVLLMTNSLGLFTRRSALAARAGLVWLCVVFDEGDDHARHVFAARRLDAFQARRGIHLHLQGSALRTQYVHARHVQAYHFCGAHGGCAFLGREFDEARGAAAEEIGAEVAVLGLALHRRHHFYADVDTAEGVSARLLDEFLHEDIRTEIPEGFDQAFRRLRGFGEHHADALRALDELDHYWGATHHVEHLAGIVRRMGDGGHG